MWNILCATKHDEVRAEIDRLGLHTAFFSLKHVSTAGDMYWSVITESFDVYIFDLSLQRSSTAGLCKVIRSAVDGTVIVLLSRNETDRDRALLAGADVFLRLPQDLHLLRLRIENLLDTR